MTYKLRFYKAALKEWQKLNSAVKEQFKNKLMERLQNPCIPSAALSGMPHCYKIKLRQTGYRLVYHVDEKIVYVTVIAIGKRNRMEVYIEAGKRLR